MPQAKVEDFLTANRLDASTWEKANIAWSTLLEIAADHNAQAERLRDSAEFSARVIQRFDAVHSVRWRIKSADHLLAKIVRKRAEGNPKYTDVSQKNYYEIVTDLVGVRALHLFKDDCFLIDRSLKSTWEPHETPIAYLRSGDPEDLTRRFSESGFAIKTHPAGYRSVHYVFQTQPLQRKVFAEVQVRTIFEEGWSEIDHRVRYPNFSDDQLVGYFLTIFNRLAGSADEMGSFVRDLTAAIQAFRAKVADATREKEEALKAMEKSLGDLEKLKKQDAATNAKLTELQAEVNRLRASPSLESIFSGTTRNAFAGLPPLDTKLLFADLEGLKTLDTTGIRGLLGMPPVDNPLILKPSGKK